MKKMLLFIFLLMSISYAQKFDIELGVNHSWMHYPDDFDVETSFYPRLNIAGNLNFNIGDDFNLRTGIGYIGIGVKIKTENTRYDWVIEAKGAVNNIYVPLVVDYNFSELFFVRGGVKLSYAISSNFEETYYDLDTGENYTVEYDSVDDMNRFNVMTNIGFGFNLTNNIYTSLQYDYVLTKYSDNEVVNRHSINFIIGYRL